MANVLSLAMRISADATGVRQGLSPLEKSLQQIDRETANVTAVFKKLGTESAAAAAAQEKFDIRVRALVESLRAGLTSPQDFARSLEQLQAGANEAAADIDKAGRIIEANLTRQQRAQQAYDREIAEYNRLRAAGLLDEQQFGLAVQRSADSFAKATVEANKYGAAVDKAGDGGALKFNELSGVLSALPGPIGNVAGRLSGLSSAGEGLSRVFGGGLSQGLSSIGASVAGLVNPFTAAVAGVAAFGAAAVAITNGLTNLENRVENLGNTADKLGVSFEFIQTLEEAANRSGTSIDAVSAAFGRLQKSVTGVDEESKAAQTALKSLGITAEELQALKPEDQYLLIGERLQGIEDPAKRTAAAIQLFGKSGADLLPFFRNIGGASDDMERFGRALTALDRRRIDEFGAGLDALGVATQGLGQSLLLPFVGLGEGIARSFAEITAGITAVIDPIGQTLEPVLSLIGTLIEGLGIGLGTLGRIIGTVFQPFAALAQSASQAIEPLADGFLALVRYLNDGSVAVAEWVTSFTPVGVIAGLVGNLGETISRVSTIVVTAFGKLGEVIGNTLGQAVEWVTQAVASFAEFTGLSGALSAVGTVISSVFGTVSSVFSTIANAIGGTVGRLLTLAENFLGIDRAAESASEGIDKTAESVKELTKDEQKSFGDLQKAIESGNKSLDDAIAKAGEFGQAGFDAAFEFQQALADLKEQADSNELNAEQYARGVANATAEFERQVESIKKVQEETKKAADEAKRKADADKQVADQLLEQARIQREFNGDTQRAQAAEQVLSVEREIARVRLEVSAAQEGGNGEAVAAGEERIRQLERIRDEQRTIANDADGSARAESQRVADQKQRIDELIAAQNQQSQIEQDIATVQQERARVEADRVSAVQAGRAADAQAAQERLNQLDAIQVKLDEQQRGFTEGYDAAFAGSEETFQKAIDKAKEFGLAGLEAAQQLEQGINNAQQQARDGIFTKEAYEAEVKRQQDLFDQRLENEKKLAAERKKADEERARIQKEQEQTVNALIKQQFGEDPRIKAAENLKAIEAEIARAQEAANAAREAGDKEALAAAQRRLGQLDQVQAKERDIASGVAAQRELLQQRQRQIIETQAKRQEEIQRQQQQFAEEQARAQQAEFERQQKRIGELNTLGSQTVKTADVRTQEGAAIVLGLAADAQDPQLIQQRLTNKILGRIAEGIDRDLNRLGQPAIII